MKKWIPLVPALLILGACSWAPPPTEPMSSVAEPEQSSSRTLLIMLPGRGDRGPDFRKQQFLDIGSGRGFDMIAADAHFGYYMNRSIIERLHEDIVVPARARGYERIWMLGISAGGLGAGMYARAHPDMINGLILLAPYPGDEALVEDIAAAGGLEGWSGKSEAGEAFQRKHWRWLQRVTRSPGEPRIVLGFGRDDRFAGASELVAERLPDDQVFRAPGGHRWPVWRSLWRDIAAAGFPTTTAP